MGQRAPLVITAGEPAGIGPELCLSLAQESLPVPFVIVSDPDLLRERAREAGIDVDINEVDLADVRDIRIDDPRLNVLPVMFPAAVTAGKPDPANASALLDSLRIAVEGCLDGTFAGLVTAPLQKSVINDAGIAFSGHTEFLAELTNTPLPVMLLAAGELRVALATTHLPLREVPDRLSQSLLRDVLGILVHDLDTKFGIGDPQVLVCGLNPHAGEGGHLGSEEDDIIRPVVDEFASRGVRVRGPLPADTAFTPAGGDRDAVLAMYHDQGLPVLKHAGFGNAVNVTLGLPIIRTSVDHGTALGLAGTGKADTGSMIAALELATTMANAV
jgi:4-hydroxythreonine-4-phosphate dehydrogenase